MKTFRSCFKIIHFISTPGSLLLLLYQPWLYVAVALRIISCLKSPILYEVTKTLVQTHKTCFFILIKGFSNISEHPFSIYCISSQPAQHIHFRVIRLRGYKKSVFRFAWATTIESNFCFVPREISLLSYKNEILKNFAWETFEVLRIFLEFRFPFAGWHLKINSDSIALFHVLFEIIGTYEKGNKRQKLFLERLEHIFCSWVWQHCIMH